MADLKSLIKLHKHELDGKRQILAQLYEDLALLNQQREAVIKKIKEEQEAITKTSDVHFTFANFIEKGKQQVLKIEEHMNVLEAQVVVAKDEMMACFSELKKYEMTQEEREALEAEENRMKELQELDEIALEGFRRKEE